MPVVKLTLSEEQYNRLNIMSESQNMSMQEYIRHVVFMDDNPFTIDNAIMRIQNGKWDGTEFELTELYGCSDWSLDRGPAGVFGKRFKDFVEKHPELGIKFERMGPRRAIYSYHKPEE